MIIILIIIVADASVKIVIIASAMIPSCTGATLTANADASLN